MDNVDTEDLILKEKLSRQLRTPLSSVVKKDGVFHLFEHFLVYGHSNALDANNLQLLFKFPSERPYVFEIVAIESCKLNLLYRLGFQSLEKFCFPTGLPLENDFKKSSKTFVTHLTKNTKNSFVLLLTTDTNETLYSVCIVDDYIKDYPTFISPRDAKTSSLSNSTRCYCLVSRYPYFELLFDTLLYLIDIEVQTLKTPLEDRKEDNNMVINTLKLLFPIKVPDSDKDIEIELPKLKKYPRTLHEPDETLIGEFCISTLYQCLDQDKILAVISAVMLERKVIFISNNLRKLTNCVMSMVSLVHPFVLQCVFIPIVPEDLVEITHAPVPFIAGVTENRLLKIAKQENPDIVVVDLDKNRVIYPSVAKFIPLPNSRQLSRQIGPLYSKLRKTFQSQIPLLPSNDQRELSRLILCETQSYMSKLLGNLRNHCITSLTDNVTIFLKESFLKDETSTDEVFNFYSEFFDTQIFSMHSDKILNDIDRRRAERSSSGKKIITTSTSSTDESTVSNISTTDQSLSNSTNDALTSNTSVSEIPVVKEEIIIDSLPTRLLARSIKSKSSRALLDGPRSYDEPSKLMTYEM